MSLSIEQLAEDIRSSLQQCALLRVWGEDVFRPGDAHYRVVGATASGDELRIELSEVQGTGREVLEIAQPAQAKVKNRRLRIGAAASVIGFGRTWNPVAGSEPALLLEQP